MRRPAAVDSAHGFGFAGRRVVSTGGPSGPSAPPDTKSRPASRKATKTSRRTEPRIEKSMKTLELRLREHVKTFCRTELCFGEFTEMLSCSEPCMGKCSKTSRRSETGIEKSTIWFCLCGEPASMGWVDSQSEGLLQRFGFSVVSWRAAPVLCPAARGVAARRDALRRTGRDDVSAQVRRGASWLRSNQPRRRRLSCSAPKAQNSLANGKS